jgi:hypothetical protein
MFLFAVFTIDILEAQWKLFIDTKKNSDNFPIY